MSEASPFQSCSALSKEQVLVNHTKTSRLLYHSFMRGEHEAFKEYLENNQIHQDFNGSLADGIELVVSRKRTMSDVAPTLMILLQNGAKWHPFCPLISYKMTPYHVICRSTGDHQELLELMIKELGQTLVNAKDADACTALMYAVRNANIKCVKSLIANRANVNLTKHKHIYTLRYKPNVTDMIAGVEGPLIDSIKLLHANYPHPYGTMMGIFDLLLDSGADVNKPCFYQNRTPIMYAAAIDNIYCFKKLIEKGAQVNCTDKTGQTVWTLSARAGSTEMLKCLLEDHDIDKNSIDEKGLGVLYWAVSSGNIEAVRYLLKQGVTMTSFVPQESKEACKKCGTDISCHYLNSTQLDTDPYVLAIRSNMPDIVRLMDECGCELNKSPEVLSYAIRANRVKVVDYLLCNYKYPLNYEYTDKYSDSSLNSDHKTFLSTACKRQSVEVVQLLLDHGTDPNKKYCVEKCPSVITAAINERHIESIARFIREGVNVNTRSCLPNMGVVLPLEAAVYKNCIPAAEMLLVAGCSRGVHRWEDNHIISNASRVRLMQELLKEWNVHKNNVLPLKQRCRMVILNHLCPQADKKITELPLPSQIIKYLSITELDDIVKSFRYKSQGPFHIKKRMCLRFQQQSLHGMD